MKVVAQTDDYTIFQKRNERYGIRNAARKWVNGEEKVAILLEHKLISAPAVKAPEPETAVEEAPQATEAAAADETAAEGDSTEA